jgi:23S rRNA (cytidine2498-2'-O)-methyltransferase
VPLPAIAHAFALCQIGAENALKEEVQRIRPEWRSAFARPGLVTWRTGEPIKPDLALPLVFARLFGASLGPVDPRGTGLVLPRLHVFPRDLEAGDVLARPLREELLGSGSFNPDPVPQRGDWVVDVVVAPNEPPFVGVHRHTTDRSPYPGGAPPVVLPPEAPSRAWMKLEEALAWSLLPLRAGHTAVEIGSSPGGAAWAMLRRGLRVVGVDTGKMDPRVLADPAFTHVQKTLAEVRREELPTRVHWLLLDVNLAPQVALHQVRRLVSALRATLRGVIFTLKLNDWKMAAEIPALLDRVTGMALTDVRATQLPSNRREICVAARMRA